jgi:hypothetical protein
VLIIDWTDEVEIGEGQWVFDAKMRKIGTQVGWAGMRDCVVTTVMAGDWVVTTVRAGDWVVTTVRAGDWVVTTVWM